MPPLERIDEPVRVVVVDHEEAQASKRAEMERRAQEARHASELRRRLWENRLQQEEQAAAERARRQTEQAEARRRQQQELQERAEREFLERRRELQARLENARQAASRLRCPTPDLSSVEAAVEAAKNHALELGAVALLAGAEAALADHDRTRPRR